jgi:hypothetical protein
MICSRNPEANCDCFRRKFDGRERYSNVGKPTEIARSVSRNALMEEIKRCSDRTRVSNFSAEEWNEMRKQFLLNPKKPSHPYLLSSDLRIGLRMIDQLGLDSGILKGLVQERKSTLLSKNKKQEKLLTKTEKVIEITWSPWIDTKKGRSILKSFRQKWEKANPEKLLSIRWRYLNSKIMHLVMLKILPPTTKVADEEPGRVPKRDNGEER